MILIADGGSTKCDWVLVDIQGNIISETSTQGMNPNVIEVSQIPNELGENPLLFENKSQINHIFFYGSGCGLEERQRTIQNQLELFFTNAQIIVKDDLTAAAYSVYDGVPTVAGILGTGSNSCFFDGKNIIKKLPSLGYLLGDEGSGCSLGKSIVKQYFMKKLPSDLHQEFLESYQLGIEVLIQKLYHIPKANAYLAHFNQFIFERKEHPYIQNLIISEFKNYFDYQILPYIENKNIEVSFVGSIAFLYEDILRKVAQDFGLKVGKILQKPIENLINYHKNYILPYLD